MQHPSHSTPSLVARRKPLAALVSLLALPPAAQASDTNMLAPLNVWATQVSSSSLYLGEGEISAKQADHLSDLLRDQPGVDVGGTHSTNQRINIRGLGDTDLDVTIDGADQNAFMYHHMGNLLINADILKAVDIQVGRNSILHNGLGGSVAFETKDPGDLLRPGQDFGARLSGGLATNDAWSSSLTGYGRVTDQFDLMVYGYFTDRDNPEDGDGTENIGNDGDIYNVMVKGGFEPNASNRLELAYDAYRDEGDYTFRPDLGPASNEAIPGSSGPFPTEYSRDTWTLNHELDLASPLVLHTNLYYNELTLERDERSSGGNVVGGMAINTGIKSQARSQLQTGGIDQTLTYGVALNRQEAEARSNGARVSDEESTLTSVFVEDAIVLGQSFTVTPGVRFDRYEAETASADDQYSKVSGALALAWRPTDGLTLSASRTELFEGPQLSEIFPGGRQVAQLPNLGLKPETGYNDELGIRYDRPDLLGADRQTFALTLFHTQIDDKIETVRVPGGEQDQNVGTVDIDGFEASWRLEQGNFASVLTYAHSDSEFEETGDPLDREIGDTVGLSLDYVFAEHGLVLNWFSQYVAEEDRVVSGDPKPSYDVHNVSVQWLPDGNLSGLTVTAGIDNVFDELYVSHASRTGRTVHPVFGPLVLNDYEPGRNVKVTLAYEF